MAVKLNEIMDAAMALPKKSRAKLADALISSLDEPAKKENQDEILAAWVAVAEERIRACDAGEMETIPAEVVLRSNRVRKKQ